MGTPQLCTKAGYVRALLAAIYGANLVAAFFLEPGRYDHANIARTPGSFLIFALFLCAIEFGLTIMILLVTNATYAMLDLASNYMPLRCNPKVLDLSV